MSPNCTGHYYPNTSSTGDYTENKMYRPKLKTHPANTGAWLGEDTAAPSLKNISLKLPQIEGQGAREKCPRA